MVTFNPFRDKLAKHDDKKPKYHEDHIRDYENFSFLSFPHDFNTDYHIELKI